MKKYLAILLLLAVLAGTFAFPVSAEETITDLTKVHTNLTTYLYTPYYEDSQYFEEYQSVMDEAGELLKSDDITQAEISKYYNEIRRVYAKLMQDTYDYSSLNVLLNSYDSLDGSIFTEDSWKKLLSVRDSAKKELDSPSLFSRTENMSAKQYTAYINNHIKTFTTEFNNAFNRLKFAQRPEEMTAAYLSGMVKLIRFCARPQLLSNAAGWTALQDAIDDAEKTVALEEPKAERLENNYNALLDAYFNVCNAAYDFSAAKDTLTTYHILSSKSFSKDSWERYETVAKALEKRLSEPHFFFIPLGADQETAEKYATAYFTALPSAVKTAQDSMIPMEDYNKLENLCAKYKSKTSMEGLDIKLNFLKTRVSEGEAILASKESTLKDVTDAIENIENAYKDLVMAEGHLIEEQGKVVKQDENTSRYTIIFYVASLLLAAVLAMFLSKLFYGKVNWSK